LRTGFRALAVTLAVTAGADSGHPARHGVDTVNSGRGEVSPVSHADADRDDGEKCDYAQKKYGEGNEDDLDCGGGYRAFHACIPPGIRPVSHAQALHFQCMNRAGTVQVQCSWLNQGWVNSACRVAAMTYGNGAASQQCGNSEVSRSNRAAHTQARDRA